MATVAHEITSGVTDWGGVVSEFRLIFKQLGHHWHIHVVLFICLWGVLGMVAALPMAADEMLADSLYEMWKAAPESVNELALFVQSGGPERVLTSLGELVAKVEEVVEEDGRMWWRVHLDGGCVGSAGAIR